MGRSKTYLVAIALAIGLTGAHAQTAPNESLGPKGVLTPERQKILSAAFAAHGKKADIVPAVGNALGLTPSDEGDSAPLQIVARSTEGDRVIHHVYAVLGDGGILLGVVIGDNDKALDYRLDLHQRLVNAVAAVAAIPTTISLSESQTAVDVELKFWAGVADQLQAGK